MKILITGDISDWNIKDFGIENISNKYLDLIKESNLVIYNLEGLIKENNKKYKLQLRSNFYKDFFYKLLLKITRKEQPIVSSTKKILNLLKLNKNTFVTLANNHIKDLGREWFKDTLEILQENNIKFIGAGFNNKEASKDFVRDKFVIINCNFVSSEKNKIKFKIYNATKDDYGASYQNYNFLKNKIEKYHNQNKKILLIIHGGKEMPENDKKIGIDLELVKELNSDITLIHHFHKYIKTDYEKDNIFILGDFIFRRDSYLPVDRDSGLLQVDIQKKVRSELIRFKNNEIYDYK